MRRPARILPALALLAALAGPGFGQMSYYPYYGKNKINYERFPWKSYATEHFTVYFYADDLRLLKYVVDTAESAYKTVSADLRHQLAEPVPLIFYTTFTDFEQSNIFPVTEGSPGRVRADPLPHRHPRRHAGQRIPGHHHPRTDAHL